MIPLCFQVKRPQRDNDFHGVLDGKTLVTWEVKPLAGRGSDGIRPVQMSDMATQLTSPKRRLHLKLFSKMVMISGVQDVWIVFYFWLPVVEFLCQTRSRNII